MTRVSIFAVVATLATCVLAHGPHYMPDHDEIVKREEINLLHRNGARAGVSHRLKRRSRHGKRQSCNVKSSSHSSSSDSSTSDDTTTNTSSSGSDTTKSSSSGHTSSSSSTTSASLSKLGINQFTGTNGPTIASWFRTDASTDSTNGHSWCGFPYNDNTNGFAPDVSLMLNNFGGDYNKAATAYCGLEAIVTTSTGVSKTMYIVDGFDSKWVKKEGAIDVVKNQFTVLNGGVATDDKNHVLTVTWELTGNRNEQYKFKGAGL
jgi:hypothetical protein